MEKIQLFIGSGEASLIERKVFIYSILKNTKHPIDIFVFNGTHNSIEKNKDTPVLSPMPLYIKYQNFTEFSNYRWYIPQICEFKGKAIFADSDMVCLGDIADFYHQEMGDYDILAKEDAYNLNSNTTKTWGMSLALFDCNKAKFDVEKHFNEIEEGLYSLKDLHQMSPNFLNYHPYKIGPIAKGWNDFDYLDENTKLIHYTNLYTQPWKTKGHEYASIWYQYFNDARNDGFITEEDIRISIMRSYLRKDIIKDTSIDFKIGKKNAFKQLLREFFS